jgi:hypothetical protein
MFTALSPQTAVDLNQSAELRRLLELIKRIASISRRRTYPILIDSRNQRLADQH